MRTRVAKWGNSLAVRLPRDIAERIRLEVGTPVEIEVEGDTLVLRQAGPRYALAELMAGMTPDSMHEAFDWGADLGREQID
jgi:antitoxin MazE